MALADWTFLTSGSASTGLDLTNPIVGSGSFRMQTNSTSNSTHGVAAHLDTGSFTVGVTAGRVRTLWQKVENGTGTREHAGVHFLTSAADIHSTPTTFYWCGIASITGPTLNERVVKVGASNAYFQMSDAVLTTLHDNQIVVAFIQDGDVYPIQGEWTVDVPNLGGTRLTMSIGPEGDTDFTNITSVFDAVDSSSPYTTGATEGIDCCDGFPNGSATAGWRADETTIFELL